MQFEYEPSQYGENETEQPAKVGRPRGSTKLQPDEETIKQISGLARIQCTQREAAAVLGVHADTFRDFLHAHENAMSAWEDGGETGKASLRRHQYKAAEGGNATMQIWLGKQWLDQKDKLAHVGGDKDDGPIKTENHHTGLDEFARRIASISARTATDGGNEPPDGAAAG